MTRDVTKAAAKELISAPLADPIDVSQKARPARSTTCKSLDSVGFPALIVERRRPSPPVQETPNLQSPFYFASKKDAQANTARPKSVLFPNSMFLPADQAVP